MHLRNFKKKKKKKKSYNITLLYKEHFRTLYNFLFS